LRSRAAATAADAAVALSRCRHRCSGITTQQPTIKRRRLAAAKLPLTSRCRADATAAAAAAAPPFVGWLLRCYCAAATALSRCRHRLTTAKLPPTSRCRADATVVVVIVSPHQTAAI
jgi:hypothetical protein